MEKKYELIVQPLEYDSEEFATLNDRPYRLLALIVLGLFVLAFGIWGSLAPLSSAVAAIGQVSVSGNRKMIQHLEGGIVEQILVKDGDHVKQGQLLVSLEKIQFQSELEIASAQLLESLAKEARLVAERDDAPDITFPQELLTNSDAISQSMMHAQQSEFIARKKLLDDSEIVSAQRIEQLRNQVEGIDAVTQSRQDLLLSYVEEISEWENLFEQQLVDKIRLRDITREKVRIEGEIANYGAEVARIEVQISEIESQMIVSRQEFLRTVLAELSDTQRSIAELRARTNTLKDSLARAEIRSPVDGIVLNLNVHTLGAVIAPGSPILDIVPANEKLIIDGKVATHEINYVNTGMNADIQFAGFAHVRSLKAVQGEVYEVSADALVDTATQIPYYGVKIRLTDKGQEELARNKLEIKPGMPADAMIVTGSRTLLEYLIQPFENLFIKGLREQ